MKSSATMRWTLAVLIIIAAVLAYKIYAKNHSQGPAAVTAGPTESAQAQAEAPIQGGKTADANAILTTPGPKATDAEKKAWADTVVSAATRTNTVDISACQPKPLVASFASNSSVVLVNKDSVNHTIVLDAKNTYEVLANSSKKIVADFGHGLGIYGYGCDTSRSAVGMLVVTQ